MNGGSYIVQHGMDAMEEKLDKAIARYKKAEARVAELGKVHAAVFRHLEASGPCERMDEESCDDHGHCNEAACTYCELDRLASAAGESMEGVTCQG